MRKVVLYIAMSLDGYIADKFGGVGWLAGDGSDPENCGSYPEFSATVDTVILGYKTYHQIVTELSPDSWPYQGMQSYVLTHREGKAQEGIQFVNTSVTALLTELKQQQGKNIWLCGGADVIGQALRAGIVDELTISVLPILLGNGIPLFKTSDSVKPLTLISHRSYNGIVDLCYRPIAGQKCIADKPAL